jgi:hypothetical protein
MKRKKPSLKAVVSPCEKCGHVNQPKVQGNWDVVQCKCDKCGNRIVMRWTFDGEQEANR